MVVTGCTHVVKTSVAKWCTGVTTRLNRYTMDCSQQSRYKEETWEIQRQHDFSRQVVIMYNNGFEEVFLVRFINQHVQSWLIFPYVWRNLKNQWPNPSTPQPLNLSARFTQSTSTHEQRSNNILLS